LVNTCAGICSRSAPKPTCIPRIGTATRHWSAAAARTWGQPYARHAVIADMVPDDPSIWMFHWHVNDHISASMIGRYKVTKK
jgi:FtsP/CotA-like multicopper oxidase with cupredoxin domain